MSTKFLCIGDPHIKVSNIKECELFLLRCERLIIEKKPEIIILLGDVLDTHEKIHSIPLNMAYRLVDMLRSHAPTWVIVGNHDMYCNTVFLSSEHWLNGMKEWDNVTIIDKAVHMTHAGLNFVLCPYVYPGRFKEALSTAPVDYKKMDCIFAHQEFFGCKMGAIISSDGDKWEKEDPFVISGHIHSLQKIGTNVYYPGSAMQHAWGESKKNILAMVTWTNGVGPHIEEIDLKLPRKKIVRLDMSDVKSFVTPDGPDMIKLQLSGSYEQFKSWKKTPGYKKIIENKIKIVFKPKTEIVTKEEEESKYGGTFSDILSKMVMEKKDVHIFQLWEKIINKKNISTEDIIFL